MPDPTTPALPSTDAGMDLLSQERYNSRSFALITPEAVIKVEQEAAAAALAAQQPDERVAGLEEAAQRYRAQRDALRKENQRMNRALRRARVLLTPPAATGGDAGERCARCGWPDEMADDAEGLSRCTDHPPAAPSKP